MNRLYLTISISFILIFLNYSIIHAVQPITPVAIDQVINTGFGTFNSHNQKVVSNQYGIFMTHLHSQDGNYQNNTWRLSRSTDGGSSFITIHEATHGTSAPIIETDSNGNIYLAHPDWRYPEGKASIYRFNASDNFTSPQLLTTLAGGVNGGKYTMLLDEPRQQLYYYNEDGLLNIVSTSGQLKSAYTLLARGDYAQLMYPHLYLAQNGKLYAAWTTQSHRHSYLYWDIHFMVSLDGGTSWQKPDGTSLSVPIVADNSGPTDRISLEDEYGYHNWLASFIVKGNYAHFMYLSQISPGRQHYVRYNLSTNAIDKNIYPDWKGDSLTLLGSDGFCATNPKDEASPIYCTSRSSDNSLSSLVSFDNGNTWHDHATTSPTTHNYYSIGGSRSLMSDGDIIGSYTNQASSNSVYFFRIDKGTASPPQQTPGDLNSDGHVNIFDFNLLVSKFGNPYTIFDFNAIVSNYGH